MEKTIFKGKTTLEVINFYVCTQLVLLFFLFNIPSNLLFAFTYTIMTDYCRFSRPSWIFRPTYEFSGIYINFPTKLWIFQRFQICVHHIHSRNRWFIRYVLSYLFIIFIHQMCSIRFVRQIRSSDLYSSDSFTKSVPQICVHHIGVQKLISDESSSDSFKKSLVSYVCSSVLFIRFLERF